MKFLQNKLKEWLEANIITKETYHAILDYENHRANRTKDIFITSLFVIAYLSLGIGILSLIAANWEYIPAFWKFFVLISLHLFIAYLIIRFKDNNRLKEGLILLFQSLFLVEIALTSQVFQLDQTWYNALLFWGFLMIFPTVLSYTVLIPLWNVAVLHTSLSFVIIERLEGSGLHSKISSILVSYMIIFIVFEIVSQFFLKENFTKALRIYGTIFYFLSLFWLHIQWYFPPKELLEKPLIFFNTILILLLFILFFFRYKHTILENTNIQITLILIFIFIFLNYFFSHSYIVFLDLLRRVIGTLLFLLTLILTSYIVFRFHLLWLFHCILLMILLRLYIVYVEIFENLTLTGFGLSAFGIFILVSILIYKKLINYILS